MLIKMDTSPRPDCLKLFLKGSSFQSGKQALNHMNTWCSPRDLICLGCDPVFSGYKM